MVWDRVWENFNELRVGMGLGIQEIAWLGTGLETKYAGTGGVGENSLTPYRHHSLSATKLYCLVADAHVFQVPTKCSVKWPSAELK